MKRLLITLFTAALVAGCANTSNTAGNGVQRMYVLYCGEGNSTDKSRWTHPPDVQAWNDWPVREPALLFCGLAYQEPKYLELWKKLPATSTNIEVLRNEAITQPLLWLQTTPNDE